MTQSELKLNLGSGDKRIEGFLNVDYSEECDPDIVMDLEETPWSFEDDSVSHIVMNHVLEHLGQTPAAFIAIIKELYRICCNKAIIDITVPHASHENFVSDPTHVRAITPMTLALFDREENLKWRELKAANSPLALQFNVNFKIENHQDRLDQSAFEMLKKIEGQDPLLAQAFLKHGRNIISESWIQLRVVKDSGEE